jgi:hypothetical protein
MMPRDLELLQVAAAQAPIHGVRVTARRGVWTHNGPWQRFEDETTITGWVADLNDQAVELMHGWLTVAIVLGDVEHVDDDVSLSELSRGPSRDEALALGLPAVA